MRLISLAAVILLSACSTWNLRISQAQLQRDMARQFPVELDKHVVVIRLTDPRIELASAPRLGVRLNLAATTAGAQLTGHVRVEGRIEYVKAEHAFYLRQPRLTELHVDPPPASSTLDRAFARARRHVKPALLDRLARTAVEEVLRHRPVYRLDARRNPKEAKAIRHLRSVTVEDTALVLEVGM